MSERVMFKRSYKIPTPSEVKTQIINSISVYLSAVFRLVNATDPR